MGMWRNLAHFHCNHQKEMKGVVEERKISARGEMLN